jgi:hypothetical protein
MVKAAHVRLCHSRMLFVRAYPRETQEMVFDAHDRRSPCSRAPADAASTITGRRNRSREFYPFFNDRNLVLANSPGDYALAD